MAGHIVASRVARSTAGGIAGILFCLVLAGCQFAGSQLQTRPATENADTITAQLNPQGARTTATAAAADLATQYNQETSPEARRELRNRIVFARLSEDDREFGNYAYALWGSEAGTSVLGDWTVLGLTGAGSLAGGAANALSAAATGVTGAKTALQKDVLYSETMASLLFSMTFSRAQMRAHIQQCLTLPDSRYDLSMALYDVMQYHQAMNLPTAIATITTTTTIPLNPACGAGSSQSTVLADLIQSMNTATATQLEAAMTALKIPLPAAPTSLAKDREAALIWASTATLDQLTSFDQQIRISIAPKPPASTDLQNTELIAAAFVRAGQERQLKAVLGDLQITATGDLLKDRSALMDWIKAKKPADPALIKAQDSMKAQKLL